MKSIMLEELGKLFKLFARYNRANKEMSDASDLDHAVISSDLIIDKLLNDWLPTQQIVDHTMGGLRVYADLKTNKGKKVNYGLCITSELAELLDSIPWKHWKDIDGEVDLDNYATELIDLMHFLPSAINVATVLLDNTDVRDKIALDVYTEGKILPALDGSSTFSSEFISSINKSLRVFANDIDTKDIYELTSRYQSIMSAYNADITSFFIHAHFIKDNDIHDTVVDLLVSNFSTVAITIRAMYFMFTGIILTIDLYSKVFGVSTEEALSEMWNIYLVKNVLNIFRVNNGYRDKTYIKEWNGEEDNVVVKRLADDMIASGSVDKDMLYEAVDTYYKNNVLKQKQ